jgi:peptide/nickel transport system substrate-binding protein
LTGAAACGPPREQRAGLNVAVTYRILSLDPHALNTFEAYELASQVYEPLTALDRDMKVVPCLADSWTNPDPRTWVFHLRPSVRFHRGGTLTARDVVFSLERLLGDTSLEVRSHLASVASVSAQEDDTVIVRTRWPNAQLASRLSFALIVRSGSTSETLQARPDGTGPFLVASWAPASSLLLRRHEGYWGRRPPLSPVRIDLWISPDQAISGALAGRYQVLTSVSREEVRRAALGTGRYRLLRQPDIFMRHLAFDVSRDATPFCPVTPNPFKKRSVREAVSLALDRTAVAKGVDEDAEVATQLVPQGIFGHDPDLPAPAHDPGRSQKLLAEAGLAGGFDVTLHHPRGLGEAASLVREQLAPVGIRVRLAELPTVEFFQALNRRELTFWIVGDGCASGDAVELLESSFHSSDPERGLGVDNYGEYRDAEVDRGIEEAAGSFAVAQRRRALQALTKRIMDDFLWVPLYIDSTAVLVDKSYVYVPRRDAYFRAADVAPARQ